MGDDHSGDSSKAAFWAKMIDQLAGSGAGGGKANSIIMAGSAIECDFGEKPDFSNYAIYEIADTMPKWSLTWDGSKVGSFFGTYSHWLSEIHPTVADPSAANQLPALKQKIATYDDGIGKILKAQYQEYIADNCLKTNADGSCAVWLGGASDAAFQKYWKQYQGSTTYKQQVAALTQEIGQDIGALQSQYNTLAEKAYGPNYLQIEQAQAAASKANPMADNSSLSNKELMQFQMQTRQGTAAINVPRYVSAVSIADFNAWLAKAKSGAGDQVTMELKTSDHETDTSHYQFAGGGGFPIEDIFMIGGSVSGSNTTVNIDNYDFDMLVTYQSVLFVPLAPATSWYVGSMLGDYKDFQFSAGSAFAGRAMWGPTGCFNLRVNGCYVAYGQTVKFTVADWTKFTSDTKWSEKSSFSLFGLINIASESASGENTKTKVTSLNNGFELADTSGVPKIIALSVDTINYP